MGRWLAATIVGAVAALSMGATTAVAAAQPELLAVPFRTTPGAVADTDLDLTLADQGPPAAKIVLYVPTGYSVALGQPVGTKIADVSAKVTAGGSQLLPNGQVVVDSPAKYASDPKAQACAPGTHAAVWLIQIGTLAIPMFVDPATSLGSYQAQLCLPSPEVAESAGGAPGGVRLLEADLDFANTFTNPAAAGLGTWRAFVTPYTSGTAVSNPAGTVEVRSIAIFPFTVSLKGRYDKRHHRAVLTGVVSFATLKPSGFGVLILSATTARFTNPKAFAVARTTRGGKFTVRKRIARTLFFTPFVPPTSSSTCTEAQSGTTPCVGQTTSPAFGPLVRVRKR